MMAGFFTALWLLFWLLSCGTLQALAPAWRYMGHPSFPFLLGVVLYAAYNKKRRWFFAAALLAALLEDSLSLAPLGTSALAFLAAGAAAMLLRIPFHTDKIRTLLLAGAVCSAVSTAVMALTLRAKGVPFAGEELVGRRMLGAALLGAATVPLLFAAMRWMERLLGIWEDRD